MKSYVLNSISPELCPLLTRERACSGNKIEMALDLQNKIHEGVCEKVSQLFASETVIVSLVHLQSF